jgi:HlyD family secretion protein
LVAALLAILYWIAFTESSAEVTYRTEPVARGNLIVKVEATGTIEPTNQVEISSELSGTVRTVEVDFNTKVTAGQVLAQLNTDNLEANVEHVRATLEAREARVQEVEATVSETKSAYDRALGLSRKEVSAQKSLEEAKAAYERAIASLRSANADVAIAKADLRVGEANLAKAEIRSPINGIVLERNVEPGQTVAASLQAPKLFTLAEDLSQMQLQVDIDEADIGKVKEGHDAVFYVEAYVDRAFPAHISELRYAPETVEGVVTYKAILTIDNAELLLRPGMTATATINVEDVRDSLLVPNAALRFTPPSADASGSNQTFLRQILPQPRGQRRPTESTSETRMGGSKHVWVLSGQELRQVGVTLGPSDGNKTVIVSGDLKPGDLVIIDSSTSGS